MISKEDVFKFMDDTKAVLTFKQFGNGDYVPFEGYITAIKYENNKITTVNLKSMYGDNLKDVPIEDLYLQEDIQKLRKVILLKEIEALPKQIEILEIDLKHKKRKLEKYKKQLEEVNKNEQ